MACSARSGLLLAHRIVCGGLLTHSHWHDVQVIYCSERPEGVFASDMTNRDLMLPLVRGQKRVV